MSGIAGVFRLDGQPVVTADLVTMTDTMLHRGPDGIGHWASGPVGLAHCMLRTTPQSLGEIQPVRSASGGLCLTLDGRIDNRSELAEALGERHVRGLSDADLLLRCYQRWGLAAVVRLLGDFAFALWDGNLRQLICGRDFLGKRPFYYSAGPRSFRFASEPQAVLADPSVPRAPNEGMIGEFLTAQVTSTRETLFRDLFRLPPAHLMVVTPLGLRVTRYWDWNPRAVVRCRSDDDYATRLLELCTDAAEVRLASPYPLALSLSGGVDSSSVVGLVQQVRRQGANVPTIDVFSMVHPGRACDESSYIHAVAAQHRLQVQEFQPVPVGADPYEDQVRKHLDLSDYPLTMVHRGYWAAAREQGCRALLTGKGPDEWLTGSYLSLADRLRHMRVRGTLAEIRDGAETSTPLAAARHLWQYGVEPLLPDPIAALVRSAMGRAGRPDFLRASFCRDIQLAERIRTRVQPDPSFACAAAAANLSDGWQAHGNEMGERAMASVGLECRDPFDDRRVVEFALALPEEQRRNGATTKFVLRQAMKGLIPEPVRTRRDKGNYSHVICEELLAQGGAKLFTDLELVRRGWVDGARISAMYDHLERSYCARDPVYHRHMWPLWLVVSIERWLRVSV